MNTEIKTNYVNVQRQSGLTEVEETQYFTEYENAVASNNKVKIERIQNIVLAANQRLVSSIARKYVGRGLDMADLVQEGNMGLLKAMEKFDISMGNKFSTYAVYWIEQTIEQAFYYQAEAIRIPVYLKKALNQINKAKSQLAGLLEREPSVEEIAQEVNMSADKVNEYLSYVTSVSSLDKTIGDEDTTMLDMVSSKTISADKVYAQKSQSEALMDLVSTLPYSEQVVITYRYGLDNQPTETLEKIGKRLNVSHERVRQIERNALALLRKRIKDADLSFAL